MKKILVILLVLCPVLVYGDIVGEITEKPYTIQVDQGNNVIEYKLNFLMPTIDDFGEYYGLCVFKWTPPCSDVFCLTNTVMLSYKIRNGGIIVFENGVQWVVGYNGMLYELTINRNVAWK
ncbi:MAG: hypothetical protein GF411_19900 [Candidatus Lokiarchaeota archaeon]|nr:hypothetical protein [Candidatus Lokiarchaeota archaeon]